jgi:hypothetical protein
MPPKRKKNTPCPTTGLLTVPDGRPVNGHTLLVGNKLYYPEFVEFMTALQDEGCIDPKSKDGLIHFPKLIAVCGRVYDKMKAGDWPPMTVNRSRVSRSMSTALVLLRKQIEKSEVFPQMAAFGKPESSTVFILHNDIDTFGFDLFLERWANHCGQRQETKMVDRTPSDAIRVAGIMLHQDNLKAVVGILSGVRDRSKCDQSVDPTEAWCMHAVDMFKDIDIEVETPFSMDPDDVDGWDPNDAKRVAIDRDHKWFWDTWRYYLRKKYKIAIKRWDKETGGGMHLPHQFSNFCDPGCRWLVWVYLLDKENDFLLYTNAHGSTPSFIGKENGFTSDEDAAFHVDGPGDDDYCNGDDHPSTPAARRITPRIDSSGIHHYPERKKSRREPTAAQFSIEHRRSVDARAQRMGTMIDDIEAIIQAKKQVVLQPPLLSAIKKPVAATEGILQSMISANRKKKDLEEVASCMSPSSRAAVMEAIVEEIIGLGHEYKRVKALEDDM